MENNKEADAMADQAANAKSICWQPLQQLTSKVAIRCFFDGSAGKTVLGQVPAAGIVVQAASSQTTNWINVATLGVPLQEKTTSMLSETAACIITVLLVRFIVSNENLPNRAQINAIIEDSGVEVYRV